VNTRILTTAVLSAVLLSGCGDNDDKTAKPKVAVPNETTQDSAAKSAVESTDDQANVHFEGRYAEMGVVNTWPDMSTSTEAISDHLTAKNYYIVFDGSGSMMKVECSNGQSKYQVAIGALKSFYNKIPADANTGLFIFDREGISERLSLGSHTSNEFSKAISNPVIGGGTPLSASVKVGYEALEKQARKQLGYGEYHLVIVTDGEASEGYEPTKWVGYLLDQSPVVVHTIGFCIDTNHTLNRPGETLYSAASNPEALSVGLESVLAEAPSYQTMSFEEK
jgi:Ca-activated chloride channel family protein